MLHSSNYNTELIIDVRGRPTTEHTEKGNLLKVEIRESVVGNKSINKLPSKFNQKAMIINSVNQFSQSVQVISSRQDHAPLVTNFIMKQISLSQNPSRCLA